MAGAEFGGQLRAERERRGMTLERVFTETKVHVRHLEELERGEYEALPGGVIRKGMVRAYIRALGLEEPVWMARFEDSFAAYSRTEQPAALPVEPAWVEFAENVRKSRGPRQNPLTDRWMGVAALFFAVFAAAWFVWHFVLRTRMTL